MTDFNAILSAHAKAVETASKPREYRGWSVSYDMKPIPLRDFDWTATHPDYDASWEGEEDGWVDNGLQATAATYEELCELIDELQEERP